MLKESRIVIIDGCASHTQVAQILAACEGIPGVLIVGVDEARGTDETAIAVMRRDADKLVLIDIRELEPAPEAIFEKFETPRPAEGRRLRVWEGMKRIAGADIRRFLPRRT